jgi:hypothetical protein
MRRVPLTSLIAACAILAAAGCGSDADDEGDIEQVLETTFTTIDPVQCETVTRAGLEQLTPSIAQEKDPVAACQELVKQNESGSAQSIEISDLEVDGDTATATVTPAGGTFAGTVLTIGFVNEDGWKWNSVEEAEIADRDEYLASLQEATTTSFGAKALQPDEAKCVVGEISQNASDEELSASITDGEKGFVYDSLRTCVGGGTDLIAITFLLNNQLRAEGLPKDQADCISGIAIAGLKGATLEEFAEDPKVQDRILKVIKKNATFCILG